MEIYVHILCTDSRTSRPSLHEFDKETLRVIADRRGVSFLQKTKKNSGVQEQY